MMILYLAAAVGSFSWWLTRWLASPDSPIVSLDHPNERSLHRSPTPRTGGVAIMGAMYLGLLILGVLGWIQVSSDPWVHWVDSTGWWICMMTGVVSVVSFVEDRRGVPIAMRFGIHLGAAAMLVFGSGLLLPSTSVSMLAGISWGWSAAPITILFLVWMANLYNFMDGIDGFAGGMTVIGYGVLAYLAWQAHHTVIAAIAILQCAAAAGFLIHNFPPAKIFMGDVGSVSSGFLAAALIVLGCRDGVFDLWVPVIIFSPFILDATVTLARRALHRETMWVAHRDHYYQRLVLSGWSHRQTVLAEYGVMALCAGLAVLYQHALEEWRLIILGFWGTLFFSLALAVKGVERRIQPIGS